MKKLRLTMGFVFGFLLLSQAAEKDMRHQFEQVCEIEGTFSVGQQARVVIPGVVYGQCRNFPNDLRIFGSGGLQWPGFLYQPIRANEMRQLEPEVLNQSYVSGREPHLQFDLVIPKTGTGNPIHNQLSISTSGRDYIRRVEIYSGSPDAEKALMAVGHLINFSRQRSAQNRIIRYPASDHSRLHVRIYPNAQKADETFSLQTIKLRHTITFKVEREPVAASEMNVPKKEEVEGAQTWLLDLGIENRPVGFVRFSVESPSYARSVSVFGRNSEYDPWKWAGGGEIHSLKDDEQTEVRVHAAHRFLKIQVFNYDDQPLAISAVKLEAVPRHLIFEAASDGEGALYFRAWDQKRPKYDLKGRIETERIAKLPILKTKEATSNHLALAKPWRKYSKWLGILVVAGVSLLVIGIIASMLKQQKPEAP